MHALRADLQLINWNWLPTATLPRNVLNRQPCIAPGWWRSALKRRSRGADKWSVIRLRTVALLACASAALSAGSAQAAKDPYASLLAPPAVCGSAADALSLEQAVAVRTMLCLTNYARTRSGLEPLRANPLLAQAGQAKLTADLACGELSHTPCGKPFRSVFAVYLKGASSYQLGENIAWGSGNLGTPRQTMNSWLHSTRHRENILTPGFRDLGIGYEPDETFQGYSAATLWSQEFATRN